MGLMKGRIEGGQGGKRGHSGMEHRATTEAIKEATRRRRRLEGKKKIRDYLDFRED